MDTTTTEVNVIDSILKLEYDNGSDGDEEGKEVKGALLDALIS
jgi:hypothetical protein